MCIANEFWRFSEVIKQKNEALRIKNLQNWVFIFLNDFSLSFFFQIYVSTFHTIQICLPTCPPCEVGCFWLFQRALKMSSHFFKWFFFVILLPNIYFYVSHDSNLFTNVSLKWSRLFLIISTCIENEFQCFKWFFFDILLPNIYFSVSHGPNLFTNVSHK